MIITIRIITIITIQIYFIYEAHNKFNSLYIACYSLGLHNVLLFLYNHFQNDTKSSWGARGNQTIILLLFTCVCVNIGVVKLKKSIHDKYYVYTTMHRSCIRDLSLAMHSALLQF